MIGRAEASCSRQGKWARCRRRQSIRTPSSARKFPRAYRFSHPPLSIRRADGRKSPKTRYVLSPFISGNGEPPVASNALCSSPGETSPGIRNRARRRSAGIMAEISADTYFSRGPGKNNNT
ncbi:hypothetical protein B4135_3039 [Caldibacillus debilis]|uniref:Uncharacterized protein n=1 Tax=Caldibacillus debilis TaxID=301148 RepID=A0A150LJN8_9BACI|nr:hypothetical protein B4135_3039 [Caldibacillus debilis]